MRICLRCEKELSNENFISNRSVCKSCRNQEAIARDKIECKTCGYIYSKRSKYGCSKCDGLVVDLESLINKSISIYGDRWDFSKTVYGEDVVIICKEHGEFKVKKNSFLGEKRVFCNKCKNTISEGESLVLSYLQSNGISFEREVSFGTKYFFDFYLPNKNLVIEYDGELHFQIKKFYGGEEGFEKRVNYDLIKEKILSEKGISLLRISYLNKSEIPSIIENFLKENNSGMKLLKSKGLYYSDVNLLAQIGVVKSRKSIPVEGWRIVVSAMTSIICRDFIVACSKLPLDYQPTLHIPRDNYWKENIQLCKDLGYKNIFCGIGLETTEEELNFCLEKNYTTVFLDIASGYLPQLKKAIPKLKNKGFKIICGSVHTKEGVDYLSSLGTDIIRLGIGTSSQICSTRYVTGVHRPPMSELIDCVPRIKKHKRTVLADGGFIHVGDYAKSFLAGSEYCMGARFFTKAKEARMHTNGGDGTHFGMSNPSLGVSNTGFDESFIVKIDQTDLEPLETIIKRIWDGIRSCVSYSGHSTLAEAIGNGVFEVIHK